MTILDICNMALSSLGHERRVTDLAAQTKEALLCSTWHAAARQSVLGAAFWAGLSRVTPEQDGEPDGASWRYPAPCRGAALRLEASAPDGTPADIVAADGLSLLLAVPRASFRFMPDSEDPEAWPHAVRDAVAAELAARVAWPLTGQRTAAAQAAETARDALSRARAESGNLTRRHGTANPYADARREGWS